MSDQTASDIGGRAIDQRGAYTHLISFNQRVLEVAGRSSPILVEAINRCFDGFLIEAKRTAKH